MASGAACFAFVVTAVGLAVLGLVLGLRSPANTAIYAREGSCDRGTGPGC